MHRFARVFFEIGVLFSRDHFTFAQKVKLLFGFYLAVLRKRFSAADAPYRFSGLTIYADSGANFSTIIREVFLLNDYYFKSSTPAPRIIDCGANIGISTLYFKSLYPQATILSIEPSPKNMSYVKRNIEANNTQGVTMLEVAASDTEGTVSFWEHAHKPGGSTMVKAVYESKVKESFVEYSVPAVKLSKHLPWQVDLLKMDVEGAEGSILKDLSESGSLQKIDRIIMEYHDNEDNTSNNLVDIITVLKKAKFTIAFYTNEFNISSERLVRTKGRHFMIRADRVQ